MVFHRTISIFNLISHLQLFVTQNKSLSHTFYRLSTHNVLVKKFKKQVFLKGIDFCFETEILTSKLEGRKAFGHFGTYSCTRYFEASSYNTNRSTKEWTKSLF